MKIYRVQVSKFLAAKSTLDQAVFWRLTDQKDVVEVRPVFKFARQIVERIAIQE